MTHCSIFLRLTVGRRHAVPLLDCGGWRTAVLAGWVLRCGAIAIGLLGGTAAPAQEAVAWPAEGCATAPPVYPRWMQVLAPVQQVPGLTQPEQEELLLIQQVLALQWAGSAMQQADCSPGGVDRWRHALHMGPAEMAESAGVHGWGLRDAMGEEGVDE